MLVHGDKLRWLAWLRVKMLTRSFRRKPATLILAIIGILVLLFVAGELAFVLFLALTGLSTTGETEVLTCFSARSCFSGLCYRCFRIRPMRGWMLLSCNCFL